MRKIIRYILWNIVIKYIAKRIVYSEDLLTPAYLSSRGWIEEDGCWIEPNIKDRDRIYIEFEHHYFRVYHSANKTFIGLESKVEWFEVYYMLLHDRNRYELASV